MRNLLCATALLFVALVGEGCKKSPSLEGKWNATLKNYPATLEFKPGGALAITINISNPRLPKPISIVMSGTYKVEGEKLTQTLTDIQVPGQPPMIAQAMKQGAGGKLNKPETGTVKFTSDDAATLTDADGTVAITRVKDGA